MGAGSSYPVNATGVHLGAVRHDIRHKCDEYSSGDVAAGVEVRGAGYHR